MFDDLCNISDPNSDHGNNFPSELRITGRLHHS